MSISEEEKKRKKSEYNRIYRETHKESIHDLKQKWRQEHKKETALKDKEYKARKRTERELLNLPAWMRYYPPDVIKTKKCNQCGKELPLCEMFFNYLNEEDRWQINCIVCTEKDRERKRKQREKTRANKLPTPPPLTAEQRKEKNREYYKQYYQENHEFILERKRELRKRNIDHIREKRKEYMQTPKGRELKANNRRTYKQNRRARENGLEASFTAKQWEECKSFFNGCCAYCGQKADMTMDHFISVAKGGEYSRDNALPACASCNSDKRDLDFWEWYPAQSFYSKLREKKLLKYLNYKAEGIQQRTLFG